MARFNPGLLANRTRMAGFRIEIRAIGSAAADRAYARIPSRLSRKRKNSEDMCLGIFTRKPLSVPAFGGRAERLKNISEPTARYVPLD